MFWERVELVWVIGIPEPSLIIMSFEPVHGGCREGLLKSEVTWCKAPLSKSQVGSVTSNIMCTWLLDEWMKLRSCWAS